MIYFCRLNNLAVNMQKIKVFGHKMPDTDSICSAIAYSWYLNEIKDMPAIACRLGKVNKETEYVLKRFDFTSPTLIEKVDEYDDVVIVDTNNPDELIDLDGSTVLEVLDHHKLVGGIDSDEPINFTLRKTCSTASVIYLKLKNRNIWNIPRNILGLLLAAIVSDSVNFTSPTTTPIDREIAREIAQAIHIDINKLALEMFTAKSDVNDLSAEEMIYSDSKVYDGENGKIRVSVIETLFPDSILAKEDSIAQKLIEIKKEEKLADIFFFVVDLNNNQSVLISNCPIQKSKIREAFEVKNIANRTLLPGIISRKKQIVPVVSKF